MNKEQTKNYVAQLLERRRKEAILDRSWKIIERMNEIENDLREMAEAKNGR